MADYQSGYAGSIIDEAISRALTLTKLDGTVLEDGNETYVVVASGNGNNYSYHPLKFSQMPVQVLTQNGATTTFQLFTINGRGPQGSNPGAYILNAGRIPYEMTIGDNPDLIKDSVFQHLKDVIDLSNTTKTNLNNHIENKLSLDKITELAENDTKFYHIEGKVCHKWNQTIQNADRHIEDINAIHLTEAQKTLLINCQTHLNDTTQPVPVNHLSSSDRAFLTDLQSSSGDNSIIKIQNNLANKIDSAFEIGSEPPSNQKKLWIDTANQVLKYYHPTEKKWIIVPVAYS